MHARALTEEEFADELDQIEVWDRRDISGTLVIAGDHPRFGAITALQTLEGIMLVSENPLYNDIDVMLANEDAEILAAVARHRPRQRYGKALGLTDSTPTVTVNDRRTVRSEITATTSR